jgi:outer membrane protein OmpA-like peptidoglycan-associated protein
MKTNSLLIIAASAGFFSSCATTVPKELVSARETYQRVSTGGAAQVAPAEVHVAHEALVRAEQSFQKDPDSYQTRDLAYVAQRKAELAEANASIAMEQKHQTQAQSEYQATQGKIVKQTKQELNDTRAALQASQTSGEVTADQLAAEQEARAAADKRAAEAQAALAKLALVKNDTRGMVITLSGSVLFASNQADLLPEAQRRLDQVAEVLLTTRERNITIDGYTDSRGSDSGNVALSQRRADAVRNYLIARGYDADRIHAYGQGKADPVADNASAEGRANNRRVEIIVEREAHTSNP